MNLQINHHYSGWGPNLFKKKKSGTRKHTKMLLLVIIYEKLGYRLMFLFIFDFPKLSSICIYTFISSAHSLFFLTYFKSQGNWSFSLCYEINRSIILPWGIYKTQEDVIIAQPLLGQPTSSGCSKFQRKHRKWTLHNSHH